MSRRKGFVTSRHTDLAAAELYRLSRPSASRRPVLTPHSVELDLATAVHDCAARRSPEPRGIPEDVGHSHALPPQNGIDDALRRDNPAQGLAAC